MPAVLPLPSQRCGTLDRPKRVLGCCAANPRAALLSSSATKLVGSQGVTLSPYSTGKHPVSASGEPYPPQEMFEVLTSGLRGFVKTSAGIVSNSLRSPLMPCRCPAVGLFLEEGFRPTWCRYSGVCMRGCESGHPVLKSVRASREQLRTMATGGSVNCVEIEQCEGCKYSSGYLRLGYRQ